jgi:putative SOS response-associated peptidase YedK
MRSARSTRRALILFSADFDAWLSPGELPLELLDVPETPEFEAVPVSGWLNSPKHDDARCMDPILLDQR